MLSVSFAAITPFPIFCHTFNLLSSWSAGMVPHRCIRYYCCQVRRSGLEANLQCSGLSGYVVMICNLERRLEVDISAFLLYLFEHDLDQLKYLGRVYRIGRFKLQMIGFCFQNLLIIVS